MARKPTKTALPAVATLNSLLEVLATTRLNVIAAKKTVEDLEVEESSIEQRVEAAMNEQGMKSIRGTSLLATLVPIEKPKVNDWPAFINYMIRHKRPDLLQKRLHEGAVQELLDAGKKLPGVNIEKFEKLKITPNKTTE